MSWLIPKDATARCLYRLIAKMVHPDWAYQQDGSERRIREVMKRANAAKHDAQTLWEIFLKLPVYRLHYPPKKGHGRTRKPRLPRFCGYRGLVSWVRAVHYYVNPWWQPCDHD